MKKRKEDRNEDKITQIMFFLCTSLLLMLFAVLVILRAMQLTFLDLFPNPCVILSLTGFYCPGCGFTHAMAALAEGKIKESFLYYPAVPICAGAVLIFEAGQIFSRITKGKLRGPKFHLYYFYILLGIILFQCIIKNMLCLKFGGI